MNVNTGMLVTASALATFDQAKKEQHVQVERPLTTREQTRMKINKYAPCGCGSGKKFKFCCFVPLDAMTGRGTTMP